ncbi:MAG: hypothetical protein HQL06_16520 [Nitrospirae bacterium]|nr:hypothetical protein [Nitrospirota bacterium]
METPPQSDLALLPYAHVKDMQSFRDSIENRLSNIENELIDVKGRLTGVEDRLTNVENTMMTKEYWEGEKLRLIEGIGIKFMEIIALQRHFQSKRLISAVTSNNTKACKPFILPCSISKLSL